MFWNWIWQSGSNRKRHHDNELMRRSIRCSNPFTDTELRYRIFKCSPQVALVVHEHYIHPFIVCPRDPITLTSLTYERSYERLFRLEWDPNNEEPAIYMRTVVAAIGSANFCNIEKERWRKIEDVEQCFSIFLQSCTRYLFIYFYTAYHLDPEWVI